MKSVLKVILLLLAIFPIWLTILALAEPVSRNAFDPWKDKINSKLLEMTVKRVQVIEIVSTEKTLTSDDDSLLRSASAFDVDVSQVRAQGVSPVGLKFFDENGRLAKLYRFSAKIFIQEQIPIATRNLAQGKIIDSDDIKLEWRDANSFRGKPVQAKDLLGRIVRTQVADGEPLYETAIFTKTLISRGDRVKVDVIGPGLVLTTFGIAEEAGGKGQTIRVMQIDSRKEISGTILGDHSVEVKL